MKFKAVSFIFRWRKEQNDQSYKLGYTQSSTRYCTWTGRYI